MKTNELNIELTIKTKKIAKFELPFFGKINNTLIGIWEKGTIETFYPCIQPEPGTPGETFLQQDYFNYTLERELNHKEILYRVKSTSYNKEITEKDITIFSPSEYQTIKGNILKILNKSIENKHEG